MPPGHSPSSAAYCLLKMADVAGCKFTNLMSRVVIRMLMLLDDPEVAFHVSH
jgi:hypothetical protein